MTHQAMQEAVQPRKESEGGRAADADPLLVMAVGAFRRMAISWEHLQVEERVMV